MEPPAEQTSQTGWRARVYEIIFEADTLAGRVFDIGLILAIIASVIVVMLDSVSSVREQHGTLLVQLEWFFTIVFTIEYILRLLTVNRAVAYARSFFGVIDLLAILPTYISVLFPASRYLLVIRALRLLRIFRVLKIVQFVSEASLLRRALFRSRRKVSVFLFTVMTIVIILGSLMYVIEGEENGFTSIPLSIYWAIVTLTTVGYGDIAPATVLGQTLAACIMILGYSIIAVPTGIVTAEIAQASRAVSTKVCPNCVSEGHDVDADYCKHCGHALN